ncbi:hypothetical protein AVEN_57416-1 [Araneus ventricosus]|uniref:Integrase catalytic domain-containing protein n=1 Tax=Araneus ventricosus TaxID=182803 RepID=A0A4Y2CYQ5_ARAVE|nr:hypothetical protein AVEN_57416-1 [Araneus ventricosus]
MKPEISEVLEYADDVTGSTGATKLREEPRSCSSLKEAFLQRKAKKGNYLFIDGLLHHMDKLTQEFHKMLGSSPKFPCPGYSDSNGLVERYNKVLKKILHHVIRIDPSNWDKHIPYPLFAYREFPNCTTGVSPFQLMYGRQARGAVGSIKIIMV